MRLRVLFLCSALVCASPLVVACAPTILDPFGAGGAPGGTGTGARSVAYTTSTSGEGGAGSTSTSGEGGGTATSAPSSSSSAGAGGGTGCAPATLVGIDWDSPAHQIARLDPATGLLTDLGPAPLPDSDSDAG